MLKGIRTWSDAPVIIVSPAGDEVLKVKSLELGGRNITIDMGTVRR
jgi:DNA-binding response OmpR family regulator